MKIFQIALGILAAIGGFVDIGDLVRRPVARHHDLLALAVQEVAQGVHRLGVATLRAEAVGGNGRLMVAAHFQ